MPDVIVKKSKIAGKGVFAERDFKKGEVVLSWHPRILAKDEIEYLTALSKKYVLRVGRKYLLMQAPEKYVNHSCKPNTSARNFSDIAEVDIKKGDEITSSYGKDSLDSFECECGKKACKHVIG